MPRLNIWYLSAHDQPKGQSSRTYDFSCELAKCGHQVTMFTNSYCHWTHAERLENFEKWRIEDIDDIRVVWLRTVHYKGNGLKRGLNMISNAWRSLQAACRLPDKPDVVIGPHCFELPNLVCVHPLLSLTILPLSSPKYCLRFWLRHLLI